MKNRFRVTALAAGMLALPLAHAQAPAVEALDASRAALGNALAVVDANRLFVSAEIAGTRLVKGAPYSATAVSETTQTLMDGNRIVRSATTRLARDGEGRTRQERSDGSIYLNDPLAGKAWLLRPAQKVAIELPRPLRHPHAAAEAAHADEMRSWSDSMRAWAQDFGARWRDGRETPEARREGMRAPAPPAPPPGASSADSRVIVARAPQPPGDVLVERDVRVEVVSTGDVPPAPRPGMAPLPPLPPSLAPLPPGALDVLPLAVRMPRDGGVTTSLGKRDFDGVAADGTRTAWTIPAGRIGNEKPIEIVSERWYAPDLMLVVHTRYLDPRSGESTFRLTQLKRGEPDAALFKVPADYAVRTPAEHRRERLEQRQEKADKAERK